MAFMTLVFISVFVHLSHSTFPIHESMSKEELLHYFDRASADLVDEIGYDLVSIRQFQSDREKRSGFRDPNHHRIAMNAFGKSYNIKLRKNSNLVYKEAKVRKSQVLEYLF